MIRRLPPVPVSAKATWGRRLVLFAWPLLAMAVLAFRSRLIDPYAFFANLTLALLLAGAGFVLGVAALVEIWRHGHRGVGAAVAAILLSLPLLAIPAAGGLAIALYPPINDVATSPDSPPPFRAVLAERRAAGAVESTERTRIATLQRAAYPDIVALVLETDLERAYKQALELARARGWRVVESQAPSARRRQGRIEAVAHTRVLGFVDDVVIELSESGGNTRAEMRSASRLGRHDLGENARRIRSYFADLKTRIEEQETD